MLRLFIVSCMFFMQSLAALSEVNAIETFAGFMKGAINETHLEYFLGCMEFTE